MKSPSATRSPKLRKIGLISGAVLLVVLLLLGVGYWLVVPGIANSLVRDKLKAAEAKLGLSFEIDEVATHGVSAVSLVGFSVLDPTDDTPIFEAISISASIDALALLVGERKLSGVEMQGTTLYLRRYADGSTNLERVIARAKGQGKPADEPPAAAPTSGENDGNRLDAALASFLRFFGDSWPDITVQDARVALSAEDGARPWEVDAISADELKLSSNGQSADFATTLTLKRGSGHPRWALPETITLAANLQRPLLNSTGRVAFATPVEISGVGPYPFLRLGIGEIALSEDNTMTLGGLSLGIQGDSTPKRMAQIDEVSVSFEALPPSLLELRPLDIQIKKPTLFIDHDAQFGNILNDLNQLLRAPLARHMVGVAKSMTREIALAEGREPEEDEPKSGGLKAMLAKIDWTDFLGKKAPQSLEIHDASIQVTDARKLALLNADPKIALENGSFKFSHRVINGALQFSARFDAIANEGEARGSAEVDMDWSYRKKTIKLDAKVDALSIPWLVQLTSAKLADNLRSGILHADLSAASVPDSKRLGFEGLVSLEDATFFQRLLAEEPVEGLRASYNFEGFYDAKSPIPAPKMLAAAPAIDEPTPDEQAPAQNPPLGGQPDKAEPTETQDAAPKPPERGAFVISKGHFEVNGISGEFRPAFYGLDGLAKRPKRFDTEVELPSTPVDTLFKAIPDAIKGPLAGTKMRGDFAWDLALEIPLYHAGDMKWEAKPVLNNFELISMPEAVDVRKLRDEFEMTIYDPALEWSRKVTIPKMRPVPLDWLVEHSGIEIERFEKRRRMREWPPRYAPGFVAEPDESNFMPPHPSPWAAEDAAAARKAAPPSNQINSLFGLNQAPTDAPSPATNPTPAPPEEVAPKPKTKYYVSLDGEREEHPYGAYEFIPLQYISPWMLRAAMTTEDNSFFKHGGFNWLAIRNSIEANIEAGRYVRGASTISMQLIKNIYLTRDKVMVRKLRELFLVWLMEDVVNLPKARILELYFNIIEYGPGIFGVRDAAIHYFGKRADKLSLTEVAWLVSIVPNPKKYHFYYERGQISDSWFRRMLRYVRVMTNRERATEAEYEAAKLDKPTFYKPKNGEPLMRIERPPEVLDELLHETEKTDIPGLRDLFSP